MRYLLAFAIFTGACTSANAPKDGKEAAFDAALDRMVADDQKQNWNEAECTDIARSFERIEGSAYARFNAGLAHRRCNDDASAKAQFEAALQLDPDLNHANRQLGSLRAKAAGDGGADSDAKAPPLRRNGLADPRALPNK